MSLIADKHPKEGISPPQATTFLLTDMFLGRSSI